MKIEKNVEPILNVTKNVIKSSDHFHDYYIKENNNLYQNQLPLLMQRSRIREAMLFKKLNKDNLLPSGSDQSKDEENKVSPPKLSTIRNIHVRSKKLPPLCPFYNKRGDLMPEVVASSKVFSRNILQTDANINTNSSTKVTSSSLEPRSYRPLLRGGSPLSRDKYNNINFMKNFEINFEEFQKEILYEENYSTLNYNYDEIFGHKDFYQELSEGLVDEIKILTSEEEMEENKSKMNEETKKEKFFEWGKNKRNIFLTLNSINVKIKEIVQEDKDKTSENKSKKNDNTFEYVLPFNLVPLFYYRGIEKFKLFLMSFIKWNEASQKFEIKENIPKIINTLLTNCKELKLEKDDDDDIELEELNVLQPVEFKKNMTINNRLNFAKFDKKSSKGVSGMNPFSMSMNLGKDQDKNQLFAGTNVDILGKKKIDKKKYNLYPKEEKDSDFINYNYFKFFWNISNKLFAVTIETPLISFSIPSYNIFVKQYINYELLFYLFKINFDSWDFYIIKYLSSFKIFRILLSQLTSINPKTNRSFYLEKIKSKKFDWSDCSIINIITLEEDKESENKDKKEDKINPKNVILEIKEENEEEKNEKIEEKKDINKDEKEENDKKNEEKKEENKEENNKENEKSLDNNNTIETQNDAEKEEERKEEDNKDKDEIKNENDGEKKHEGKENEEEGKENKDEGEQQEKKDEENIEGNKEIKAEENVEIGTKGEAAPIPTKEATTQKELEDKGKDEEKEKDKEIEGKEKEEEKEKEKQEEKVKEESKEKVKEESKEKEKEEEKENNKNKIIKNLYNSILEQDCFIAIVTLTDIERSMSSQYTIHFNYSHFNKFDSMEKYMKKTSFLLKFLDINYENFSIDFDYESLNTFDEKNWIKENEKYNYILESKPIEENTNKEEEKTLNVNKNRAEYAGSKKGTSIIIDIKQPIILLKGIDKNGNLFTKRFAIFYEEEKKLILNRNDEVLDLSKNIYEITLEHKRIEIEEEKNKILTKTDNLNISKKRLTKK